MLWRPLADAHLPTRDLLTNARNRCARVPWLQMRRLGREFSCQTSCPVRRRAVRGAEKGDWLQRAARISTGLSGCGCTRAVTADVDDDSSMLNMHEPGGQQRRWRSWEGGQGGVGVNVRRQQ